MEPAIAIGSEILRTAASWLTAGRREHERARRDAAGKLRSVVTEALVQLADADPHSVLARYKLPLGAAIGEVQALSTGRRRARFDAAVSHLQSCRDAVQPALLTFYESQVTGRPTDSSATARLIAALRALSLAAA